MATCRAIGLIDVRDFAAETVRVGDLSGDGAPDLLFVQSTYANRRITCLTATDLAGEVIWQHGTPNADNARIYSDLPVQVYDWDQDGHSEVLYVEQAIYAEPYDSDSPVVERAGRYEGHAMVVVLNGQTGAVKGYVPLPAPADDCFLFADLTGRGQRRDFVVKDRYWNLWGVSAEGQELWHWEGSTGHYPAYGDVDGDGRDELFVGFALIDHDGTVLFEADPAGAHQDAACAVQLPDGSWRLLFGNHGVHCLDVTGRKLWSHPLAEAQHVVAGRFCPGLGPVQFGVIDRGQPRPDSTRASATLLCYDLEGHELWRREQPPGGWYAGCIAIDWSGHGEMREILVYGRGAGSPATIYDGDGGIVDELPMQYTPDRTEADRQAGFYASRADVWGDSRHEVLLFGATGACIWTNTRLRQLPTMYNNNLYPGM